MEVKNLTFSFDEAPLFQNLSVKIQNNQFNVFLGPSGCGKSTLLRIFAGLQKVKPDFFYYELKKASFVFQDANLLEWKTGYQNIMLPFLLSKVPEDLEKLKQIVDLLQISDCLSKYPSELSGGQKMRVSIARALITEPEVLFMDEPFSALDEPTRLNLQDEIRNIQKKLQMTILFVTHSFYEAAYLGDQILIFSKEKPSAIIYDEKNERQFTGRFESNYLRKVQQISDYFISENKA